MTNKKQQQLQPQYYPIYNILQWCVHSYYEDRLQQLQQVQAFEAAAAAAAAQPQQEYLQQVKSPIQSQSQQQLQQTTTNINRKLNGFLNLKTPLIG